MAERTYIPQRQYLVTIGGAKQLGAQDGVFMTKSGGGISSESTKIYSGDRKEPYVMSGIPEIENITVSRAYYAEDRLFIKTLRKMVGSWETTITVAETTGDIVAIDGSEVTYNVLLVGLNEPDYESSSSDPSTYELEFLVSGIA